MNLVYTHAVPCCGSPMELEVIGNGYKQNTCKKCGKSIPQYTEAQRPEPEGLGDGEIKQVDREASWCFAPEAYSKSDVQNWLDGRYDNTRVIKAFARHREQAITALTADNAKLKALVGELGGLWSHLQILAKCSSLRLRGLVKRMI